MPQLPRTAGGNWADYAVAPPLRICRLVLQARVTPQDVQARPAGPPQPVQKCRLHSASLEVQAYLILSRGAEGTPPTALCSRGSRLGRLESCTQAAAEGLQLLLHVGRGHLGQPRLLLGPRQALLVLRQQLQVRLVDLLQPTQACQHGLIVGGRL